MDWPHSPIHRITEAGAYMITAGTYRKEHFFRAPERLTLVRDSLLQLAERYGWALQAWAVFSNHYHFISFSERPQTLRGFIQHLHSMTAKAVNRDDGSAGRKVWFEYWESRITYQKSYLARLAYVHSNAVHHGLVDSASAWPWCSAAWFERKANPAFYRTVTSLPTDRVRVPDDF